MGKFYVLNEIFEEIGLVFITDLVSLQIFSQILQSVEFTHAKFLLWSQQFCQCKLDF